MNHGQRAFRVFRLSNVSLGLNCNSHAKASMPMAQEPKMKGNGMANARMHNEYCHNNCAHLAFSMNAKVDDKC